MGMEDYSALARAAELVEGAWKLKILFCLSAPTATRYSQLKRALGSISHRTLSTRLKELERDGLVFRREYAQIPPRVEYSLTDKGRSLVPVLEQMAAWSHRALAQEERA